MGRIRISAIDMSNVRTDIHQVGDAFATFALCIALKELAHLEKQHDKNSFREFSLCSWQKTDAECTDGSYRHQEVLIKGIST